MCTASGSLAVVSTPAIAAPGGREPQPLRIRSLPRLQTVLAPFYGEKQHLGSGGGSSSSTAPAGDASNGRSALTQASANREAVEMMIALLATHVGKRSLSDIASVAFDPSLAFRLYPQHQLRYQDHLEAFQELSIGDQNHNLMVPSSSNSTLCGADQSVLAGSFLPRAALASLFARAAYGKMMSRGGGDRCSAFLGSAAAAQCVGHEAAAEIAAFCELAGARPTDVLASSWDERTFQPAYVVCLAHEMNWIVVAIRGSMSWKAVLTDIAADVTEVCGGVAHSGMVRSANWVLGQILPVLAAASAMYPKYSVMCTGHSLGANVAALIALQLRDLRGQFSSGVSTASTSTGASSTSSTADSSATERLFSDFSVETEAFGRSMCFAFGPSPLMSPALAARCEHFVLSIARNFDFVTRLSVFGIDKLLLEMTEQSAPLLFKQWLTEKFSDPETPTSSRTAARNRAFGSSERIPEPLVPPGRLMHIHSPSSADTSALSDVRLFWSLPGFYHQLLMSVRMFQDHLPIKYVEDLLRFVGASAGQNKKELRLEDRASNDATAHMRVRVTLESIIIAEEQGLDGCQPMAAASSDDVRETSSQQS
mmetsp:Transcript_10712/g.24409  ORF Transcript_10712/g.24409 Transcript_10712/m.24409 type:complete len:595 (+) Transcript_10712:108-1892(+)|eukprot:CAMPEP_0178468154 /NCGR_PEP_ID=MMETSP0689_2-20121128/52774_1 /TAXON_ID=160604 /ORGANISM="Amphidinium massartii, Strain CS-259" /LENGTH=594 /DNA_ID=CAMNT_0020095203 /DNA_START=38 /DNA_END=1822 /DNA_ORIENTATION=-